MRITLKNVEFRRFDEEVRKYRAYDKEGNVIPGKFEEKLSRVLRVEVDGEGVIARLYDDSQIVIPPFNKGDMCEIDITGFETVKEATYLHMVAIRPALKEAKK